MGFPQVGPGAQTPPHLADTLLTQHSSCHTHGLSPPSQLGPEAYIRHPLIPHTDPSSTDRLLSCYQNVLKCIPSTATTAGQSQSVPTHHDYWSDSAGATHFRSIMACIHFSDWNTTVHCYFRTVMPGPSLRRRAKLHTAESTKNRPVLLQLSGFLQCPLPLTIKAQAEPQHHVQKVHQSFRDGWSFPSNRVTSQLNLCPS